MAGYVDVVLIPLRLIIYPVKKNSELIHISRSNGKGQS